MTYKKSSISGLYRNAPPYMIQGFVQKLLGQKK